MRHAGALVRAAVLCAVLAPSTGCALRQALAGHQPEGRPVDVPAGEAAGESLEAYMAKIRHLTTSRVLTAGGTAPKMLEARDPGLAAALVMLAARPSPAAHLAVADRYRELGVADAAYRHYNAAAKLDPREAAAYDGLARTWRDWGFPDLALGDAHRALFHAPDSAAAHNTLGTVLQALGRPDDARASYQRALRSDPGAAYAVNNLCYLAFLEGQLDTAVKTCRKAIDLDPGLRAARNNLGLTQAAEGDVELATATLMDTDDRAAGLFNTGIVFMARREYRRAAAAFDAASRARPAFQDARRRATQARQYAAIDPDGVLR
jgi:tetratricopeptide (TPR) repeat protein